MAKHNKKPNNDRERKNEEITFEKKHNGDSKEMAIQELAMLQGSSKISETSGSPAFLRSGRLFVTWDIQK